MLKWLNWSVTWQREMWNFTSRMVWPMGGFRPSIVPTVLLPVTYIGTLTSHQGDQDCLVCGCYWFHSFSVFRKLLLNKKPWKLACMLHGRWCIARCMHDDVLHVACTMMYCTCNAMAVCNIFHFVARAQAGQGFRNYKNSFCSLVWSWINFLVSCRIIISGHLCNPLGNPT